MNSSRITNRSKEKVIVVTVQRPADCKVRSLKVIQFLDKLNVEYDVYDTSTNILAWTKLLPVLPAAERGVGVKIMLPKILTHNGRRYGGGFPEFCEAVKNKRLHEFLGYRRPDDIGSYTASQYQQLISEIPTPQKEGTSKKKSKSQKKKPARAEEVLAVTGDIIQNRGQPALPASWLDRIQPIQNHSAVKRPPLSESLTKTITGALGRNRDKLPKNLPECAMISMRNPHPSAQRFASDSAQQLASKSRSKSVPPRRMSSKGETGNSLLDGQHAVERTNSSKLSTTQSQNKSLGSKNKSHRHDRTAETAPQLNGIGIISSSKERMPNKTSGTIPNRPNSNEKPRTGAIELRSKLDKKRSKSKHKSSKEYQVLDLQVKARATLNNEKGMPPPLCHSCKTKFQSKSKPVVKDESIRNVPVKDTATEKTRCFDLSIQEKGTDNKSEKKHVQPKLPDQRVLVKQSQPQLAKPVESKVSKTIPPTTSATNKTMANLLKPSEKRSITEVVKSQIQPNLGTGSAVPELTSAVLPTADNQSGRSPIALHRKKEPKLAKALEPNRKEMLSLAGQVNTFAKPSEHAAISNTDLNIALIQPSDKCSDELVLEDFMTDEKSAPIRKDATSLPPKPLTSSNIFTLPTKPDSKKPSSKLTKAPLTQSIALPVCNKTSGNNGQPTSSSEQPAIRELQQIKGLENRHDSGINFDDQEEGGDFEEQRAGPQPPAEKSLTVTIRPDNQDDSRSLNEAIVTFTCESPVELPLYESLLALDSIESPPSMPKFGRKADLTAKLSTDSAVSMHYDDATSLTSGVSPMLPKKVSPPPKIDQSTSHAESVERKELVGEMRNAGCIGGTPQTAFDGRGDADATKLAFHPKDLIQLKSSSSRKSKTQLGAQKTDEANVEDKAYSKNLLEMLKPKAEPANLAKIKRKTASAVKSESTVADSAVVKAIDVHGADGNGLRPKLVGIKVADGHDSRAMLSRTRAPKTDLESIEQKKKPPQAIAVPTPVKNITAEKDADTAVRTITSAPGTCAASTQVKALDKPKLTVVNGSRLQAVISESREKDEVKSHNIVPAAVTSSVPDFIGNIPHSIDTLDLPPGKDRGSSNQHRQVVSSQNKAASPQITDVAERERRRQLRLRQRGKKTTTTAIPRTPRTDRRDPDLQDPTDEQSSPVFKTKLQQQIAAATRAKSPFREPKDREKNEQRRGRTGRRGSVTYSMNEFTEEGKNRNRSSSRVRMKSVSKNGATETEVISTADHDVVVYVNYKAESVRDNCAALEHYLKTSEIPYTTIDVSNDLAKWCRIISSMPDTARKSKKGIKVPQVFNMGDWIGDFDVIRNIKTKGALKQFLKINDMAAASDTEQLEAPPKEPVTPPAKPTKVSKPMKVTEKPPTKTATKPGHMNLRNLLKSRPEPTKCTSHKHASPEADHSHSGSWTDEHGVHHCNNPNCTKKLISDLTRQLQEQEDARQKQQLEIQLAKAELALIEKENAAALAAAEKQKALIEKEQSDALASAMAAAEKQTASLDLEKAAYEAEFAENFKRVADRIPSEAKQLAPETAEEPLLLYNKLFTDDGQFQENAKNSAPVPGIVDDQQLLQKPKPELVPKKKPVKVFKSTAKASAGRGTERSPSPPPKKKEIRSKSLSANHRPKVFGLSRILMEYAREEKKRKDRLKAEEEAGENLIHMFDKDSDCMHLLE